eukprot:TRINITY_DN6492_c0_g1_i1.p1 TRINITY_DN6492_c0_g1~~TRINITY_DN6492_c0_g1_i1.p1  ORF type:complete len:113 (-),score=23.94 TRINITY_DN6492_c0_g1_i1:193-531(-)
MFLEHLGYKYKYEFVTDLYRFHVLPEYGDQPFYVHIMTHIWKVKERGQLEENSLSFLFKEWVVEVYSYARDEDLVDICRELDAFCNRLVRLVNIVKLDPGTKARLKELLSIA